jgi:hypothetical protein
VLLQTGETLAQIHAGVRGGLRLTRGHEIVVDVENISVSFASPFPFPSV